MEIEKLKVTESRLFEMTGHYILTEIFREPEGEKITIFSRYGSLKDHFKNNYFGRKIHLSYDGNNETQKLELESILQGEIKK